MNEREIQLFAEKFCATELPKGFNPDGGIKFIKPHHPNHSWPTGTNLFTVEQAVELFTKIFKEVEEEKSTPDQVYQKMDKEEWARRILDTEGICTCVCVCEECHADVETCNRISVLVQAREIIGEES